MSELSIVTEMDDATEHKPRNTPLIVGLDPGTTFSGVAWQQCHQQSQHVRAVEARTVRAWPSSNGPDQDESKVPSRLFYSPDGDVKGWGYTGAEGDAIAMEWFKLALVPEEHLPSHLRDSSKLKETKENMRKLGIDVGQVMAQFLEKVWAHAQDEIRKTVGRLLFATMLIHVVITIPAIWGNRAIQIMKEAAASSVLQSRTAGLTTYEFLSEPEAAVQAYEKELKHKLKPGDSVIVLDLGGGTADIISYLLVDGANETHFKLDEAVSGDGDLCGAIFLDEAFEKLLLDRLPARYKNLKTQNPSAWGNILSEQWQHDIKRRFQWEGTGRVWPVRLSNINPDDDVLLHENEIQAVFENSVILRIIELIKRQIDAIKKAHSGKLPRVILPVGGFGRCPYMLQRLREVFEGIPFGSKGTKKGGKKKQKMVGEVIEIHSETGEMPWTAVCRGACQFGIRGQLNDRLVKSRSSRIFVGFVLNESDTAEKGGTWMTEFDGYMIPNYLKWVVMKGESISTNKKSCMAMMLCFDTDIKGRHTEHSMFYAYHGDSPPDRFNAGDPRFQEYGVMDITVPKPIEQLPIEYLDSGERRVFNYNLEIETVGGSIEITATAAAPGGGVREVGKLVLSRLDVM